MEESYDLPGCVRALFGMGGELALCACVKDYMVGASKCTYDWKNPGARGIKGVGGAK